MPNYLKGAKNIYIFECTFKYQYRIHKTILQHGVGFHFFTVYWVCQIHSSNTHLNFEYLYIQTHKFLFILNECPFTQHSSLGDLQRQCFTLSREHM